MNKNIGKREKKNAFWAYIYGYLNSLRVYQRRMPENLTWKEFKISEVGAYLGFSKRFANIFLKPCLYLYSLEMIVSGIIVIYRYLYCVMLKLFLTSQRLDAKLLLLDEGFPQDDLINKTPIEKKDIISIVIPFTVKNCYKDVRQINVLTQLSYREIFVSLLWSIQLMTYMNKKFKHCDIFIRYYSSFEFILAYLFSYNVGNYYTFLFYSTYSRWAYLNGGLSNKKIFIQHGYLSGKWKLVNKIGIVDKAYYINEEQRKICEKMLFINTPIYNYQNGLSFTYYPPANKKSILVIGNFNYNVVEEEIISKITKNSALLILVKPHPNTKNKSFYNRMEAKYGISLLNKDVFPKVDYVISYNSTLATQYEDVGITVFRYSDDDIENEINTLLQVKG